MNLPELLHDSAVRLSETPSWGILLAKASAVLAMAWLVHFALARLNPRWRVFLWRGTIVGLALLGIWAAGLPGFVIRLQSAPPIPIVTSPSPLPLHSPRDAETVLATPTLPPTIVRDSAPLELTVIDREATRDVGLKTTGPVRTSHFPAIPWETWLSGIWGLGASMLLSWLAIGYIQLARMLKCAQPVAEEIAVEAGRIGAALGCRRDVRILMSRRFAVPFVCGVRRPVIVLPEAMCDMAFHGQLPGVLAHELAHVRSHDLAWNAVLQLFSIVFWFHPLAWRAGSAHRAACDAVCDAISASYLGDVQAYRRTLASVALKAAAPAVSVGLAMARSCDVRRRLAALEREVFGSSLKRRTVACIAVVGLAALGLLAGLRLTGRRRSRGANHRGFGLYSTNENRWERPLSNLDK